MVQGNLLLLYAVVSIVVLVVLIAVFKLNAFVTLIIVSLGLGLAVGMPMDTIEKAFETGVGNTLGHIALVVTVGTMLGKMMAESGGAQRIAYVLIDRFGEKYVHWAMAAIALIVGIPVFFEVGFVLLIPIAYNVAKRTGKSMVLIGIPMVAGLSVVHGLIPPHPAALLAVTAYNADMGKTILLGLLVGIPTAAISGPVWAKLVSRWVVPDPNNPLMEELAEAPGTRDLPGFGITLFTILLPVGLMLIGGWADLFAPLHSVPNQILRFAGNSVNALLIALLVSFYTLGARRGFNRETILKFTNECVGPIALVTLVIGAGGGFGRILMDSGISTAVVTLATGASVPPLLLGWLVAALIRVATGSATVAMTTACAMVAPIVGHDPTVSPELMVLATGAGSLVLSHVNDGGFWLVQEYFNMTVPETFKTWTVAETLIAVVALLLTMALNTVI
jgi:GntP family gluconate:H+ symporter